MKRNGYSLLRIVVGVFIVGTMLFFCFQFGAQNTSFLMGFAACFICVALLLILAFIWNQPMQRSTLPNHQPEKQDTPHLNPQETWFRTFASAFIVLAGLLSIALIFRQHTLFKARMQYEHARITQQSELIESMRISNMVVLMNNVLDKVDDEVKNNPDRKPSSETIARIASLSLAFRPYRILEGDSMSKRKYSPERGQLLLALAKMNLDSNSFDRIKLSTTFAGAFLRGANLQGADLSDADLSGANLSDANLSSANMRKVNLTEANLWGADLHAADLREGILKRADLQWVDLHEANLVKTDLASANLTSAMLNNAQLNNAEMRLANLQGASLSHTNLTGAFIVGADLSRANLSMSQLNESTLRSVNFFEANLQEAILTHAVVLENDWPARLSGWHVTGAAEIFESYQTIVDKTGAYFLLVRKNAE